MWDGAVPPAVMLACEERRPQEVEASLAVDGHGHSVAEDFWVTQAGLSHAVLHQAGVRTVHHCRADHRGEVQQYWIE